MLIVEEKFIVWSIVSVDKFFQSAIMIIEHDKEDYQEQHKK